MRLEQPPTGPKVLKIPNLIDNTQLRAEVPAHEPWGASTVEMQSPNNGERTLQGWVSLVLEGDIFFFFFCFPCWYLSLFLNKQPDLVFDSLTPRERMCNQKLGGCLFFFFFTFLSVIEHKPCWLGADWLVFISAQSDFFKWLIYKIFENKSF